MSREVNLGQIVPNIQVGTTRTITPKESANVINVGTSLNPIFDFYIPKGDPGAINLLIVNELPLVGSEDTLYFVPKTDTEESDMYDEYVWINNDWELVGTKQITIDLTDYVKNTDYATASVGGVVKINSSYGVNVGTSGALTSFTRTYQDYQSSGNTLIIGKGTLENVITGKDLTTKAYVDGLVGDIGTILDNINGEVIGG